MSSSELIGFIHPTPVRDKQRALAFTCAPALRRILATGAALLLCAFLSPAAHAKKCTHKQADAAETMVDYLDSWKKIDQARRQFGHCDDGSIAEGISEAVARQLADHWDKLPALVQLIKQDRALEPFVLKHVNATLGGDDAEKIAALAGSSCPAGLTRLCTRLKAQAAEALKDMDAVAP